MCIAIPASAQSQGRSAVNELRLVGRVHSYPWAAPETTLEYGLRALAGSGGRGRLVGARVAPGWPGGRSGGAQGGPGLINSVWCETDLIRSDSSVLSR